MPLQSAPDEIPLPGSTHGPVVRVGDTVRREARPATPAVHALLRHLERAGFEGAPRALGFDEQGREVLSYIPGEVAVRIDGGPQPGVGRTEQVLVDVGRLLRRCHDATVDFVPPPDAAWDFQVGAPRTGEVICHNDLGPFNTVFVDGRALAFIDWENAAPAPRAWDVAYVAYRFVPYYPDEPCAIIGWPAPPDRPRRLRTFCNAYGWDDVDGILAVMAHRVEVMIATGVAKNAAGDPMYGEQWMNVMRQRLLRDIAFIRTQHP
jgi:Ser/Thr protein kinase RdoA (MazF antagonist)